MPLGDASTSLLGSEHLLILRTRETYCQHSSKACQFPVTKLAM